MAKIYLTTGLTFDVTNEQAEKVKQIWESKGNSIISLENGVSFRSTAIKSIVIDQNTEGLGLEDPDYKLEVLAFESELGNRSFQQYCLDKGYIFKRKGFNDYFVNRDTIEQYVIARQLNKYLEKLQEQRYYMEKLEHKENLEKFGITECPDKPESPKRCTYCYPWGIKEYLAKHRPDLIPKYNSLVQQ